MAHSDLSELNDAQRQAVGTLSGPLLVLAGAGTGKTRVITYRIAALIRSGVEPHRILAVTFTNKAAREMQQRAMALVGGLLQARRASQGSSATADRKVLKPEISTFHSLCVRILRRRITHLGYPAEFAVYDRGDQEGLARGALREIRVDSQTLGPGDLLAQVSRWKNQAIRPAEATRLATTDKEHLAAAAYRRYQNALQTRGALDFDDLLLCTEELLREHPEVRTAESQRFEQILIDEYQDTNATQYQIIKSLAGIHRNLCVVGDDDQSIYGWRGAEVTHILNFTRDWPEATVIRLEENYRSRGPILEMANTLIGYNKLRHDKVLRPARGGGDKPRVRQFRDEEDEAAGVAAEIENQLAANLAIPSDFAILFRTNEQPRPLEMELRRRNIPYTLIGGQSFYDRKEVRDLLAYLKVLVYPHDEISLLRILNTPPRGISANTVKVLTAAAAQDRRSLWEVLGDEVRLGEIPERGRQGVLALRSLLTQARQKLQYRPPAAVLSDLLQAVDYRAELTRVYKEPSDQEKRWQTVEEVVNALAAYQQQSQQEGTKGTLAEFLSEMAVTDKDDDRFRNSAPQKEVVTLMTLHSAKGLEFPYVYLVGLEEGLLPHKRSLEAEGESIDEERRLCYVGVTRAIERLTLTLTQARRKWGKLRPSVPSRFLFEMKGQADHPTFTAAQERAAAFERAEARKRTKRRSTGR